MCPTNCYLVLIKHPHKINTKTITIHTINLCEKPKLQQFEITGI